MSVNMSGSGTVGLGVGVGSYQPGVYVPFKALFLVFSAPFFLCALHLIFSETKMFVKIRQKFRKLQEFLV